MKESPADFRGLLIMSFSSYWRLIVGVLVDVNNIVVEDEDDDDIVFGVGIILLFSGDCCHHRCSMLLLLLMCTDINLLLSITLFAANDVVVEMTTAARKNSTDMSC